MRDPDGVGGALGVQDGQPAADRFEVSLEVLDRADLLDLLPAVPPRNIEIASGSSPNRHSFRHRKIAYSPIIKGETRVAERNRLFDAFRRGELSMLVVSEVANFSIDLPKATVAIQVSGIFGSRQEEAQQLGRLLRPKSDGRSARFYAVVARDTLDQEYAAHRQWFLAEQGYAYHIADAGDGPA